MSHPEQAVVDDVISGLESKFGDMSVTRGDKHNFVGMNFCFTKDGKVEIIMRDYLEECIKTFGEAFNGGAKTPAQADLFKSSEEAEKLSEEKAEIFHHVVAKLLFVAKRVRPDIDLVISYLCGGVDRSTTEDWGKLRRLLHYLNGTLDMVRRIGMSKGRKMETWEDASYGVHPDMKGHTDGAVSLGLGLIQHKSLKQKLNTKSSTESELVGASDFIGYSVWIKRFMTEQGYKLNDLVFYQDNESAIKLASNEFRARSNKSRHINIRYFFIWDIRGREGIKLMHCRTEEMIADFFTKPVQGGRFKMLRNYIMGHATEPIEERVEKCEQNHITSETIVAIGPVEENNRKVRRKTYAEIVGKYALGMTKLHIKENATA